MYIVNVVTCKIIFGLESTEVCSGVFVNRQSIKMRTQRSRSRKQGSGNCYRCILVDYQRIEKETTHIHRWLLIS